MWTALLVSVGCTGLWFAPRHWWGWAITSASECLWIVYATTRRDHALFVMAWVWLAMNLRGMYVARKAHMQVVRSDVRTLSAARREAANGTRMRRVLSWYYPNTCLRNDPDTIEALHPEHANLLGLQVTLPVCTPSPGTASTSIGSTSTRTKGRKLTMVPKPSSPTS